MIKYLAKKLLNQDGDLTGYRVGPITRHNGKPNNQYDILRGADKWENRKAELQSGVWVVVEDTTKRDAASAKRAARDQDRVDVKTATNAQLRKIVERFMERFPE